MKKIIKVGFPVVSIAIIIFTFWLMADIKEKVAERKTEKGQMVEKIDKENNENNVTVETLLNSEEDIYFEKIEYILREEITKNQYLTSEGEEDGRYIVAVRDAETTETEIYYIVDVDTGEYEIYY